MKILTVKQPWAWAIIHGGKDVENRVRNLAGDYRGPIAIHVAKQDDDGWTDKTASAFIGQCPHRNDRTHNVFNCSWCDAAEKQMWRNQGHIIGVVDLVGVHAGWVEGRPCSPWGEEYFNHEGLWHFVLRNPRPLSEPIPYRGMLHLQTASTALAAEIRYSEVEAAYWAAHPEATATDLRKDETVQQVAAGLIAPAGALGQVVDVRDGGRTITVQWDGHPAAWQHVTAADVVRVSRERMAN